MKKLSLAVGLSLAVSLAAGSTAIAQTAADSTAIVQTALDYIDGFYTGDAERMEQALHPDLAKRIVETGSDEGSRLRHMTAEQLVQITAGGGGARIPEERRQSEVTILDIYQNAASVKIVASDWIDYLHVAQWNGEWKIINVLWELKPRDR
jgi:hypothetical protein